MRVRQTPHSGAATSARDGPAQQAARFGLHFMEMCIVMCVTLIAGGVLVTAVAIALDASNPITAAPGPTAAVATVALAGSMVVWMRHRSMPWQPTLEMAGVTLVAGALVLVGYAAGLVPAEQVVTGTCGLACLAMIPTMLFRFRLYASHVHRGSTPG